MPDTYTVAVDNIGIVYDGTDHDEAINTFNYYRDRSLCGVGRAAGESVYLFGGFDIVAEQIGGADNA